MAAEEEPVILKHVIRSGDPMAANNGPRLKVLCLKYEYESGRTPMIFDYEDLKQCSDDNTGPPLVPLPCKFDPSFRLSQNDNKGFFNRVSFIMGCCNGMFCLLWRLNRPVIWNPCTGDLRALPVPRVNYPPSKESTVFMPTFYGFGYDSQSNDYKVVLGESSAWSCLVCIFSLKSGSGSWRILTPDKKNFSEFGFKCSDQGLYYNGALHWLVGYCDGRVVINKFDLGSETFELLLSTPILLKYLGDEGKLEVLFKRIGAPSIGAARGCLCYYTYDEDTKMLTIWMMKEQQGDDEKLGTIDLKSLGLEVQFKIATISISEDGTHALLNAIGRGLILYNLVDKTVVTCVKQVGSQFTIDEVAVYTETVESATPEPHINGPAAPTSAA